MTKIPIMRYNPANEGVMRWLGPLESVIMEHMWQCAQPRTVKQVMRDLDGEVGDLAYTTIATTVSRLEKKGLLVHQRCGIAYVYAPHCTRAEFEEIQERAIRKSLEDA